MDTLSLEAIQPLLGALNDPHFPVRAAALRALVCLPLSAEAWQQVAWYLLKLLDQRPEGEHFESQTLDGIPFKEVIQAAVHVPVREIRQKLYSCLASPDKERQRFTAITLARAWDQNAAPTLLRIIRSSQASLPKRIMALHKRSPHEPTPDSADREEVARALSCLDLTDFRKQVLSLCRRELDGEVRFWLSLALAGAGEYQELERALRDIDRGKIYLDRFHYPTEVSSELSRYRAFPPENLKGLENLLEGISTTSSIARELKTGLSSMSSSPTENGIKSSGKDPEEAASLAIQLIDHSPYERPEPKITQEEIEKLRPLAPSLGNRLVTTLFHNLAFIHQKYQTSYDNELVHLVSRFDNPFRPDINSLFDSYYHAIYEENQAPRWSPLACQIAWTASRAGMSELISVLSQYLNATSEKERWAAAQMMEEAARYSTQSYPPLFGGGEAPPEKLPVKPDWIALESYEVTPQLQVKPEPQPSLPSMEEYAPRSTEEYKSMTEECSPTTAEVFGVTESIEEHLPNQRVVNTGFASQDSADDLIEPTTPLRTASSYYFWIDVGRHVPQSGELTPTDIPSVPVETTLTVVLFAFPDSLLLTAGAEIGTLYLQANGQVRAQTQPLGEQAPDSKERDRRLFFPVRTPTTPGRYAIRCNIYHGQILLQSRLVRAHVVDQQSQPEIPGRAWESVLDYTLTNEMNAGHLTQLEPEKDETHKLSILLNKNEDGTHSFHFFGKNEIPPHSASFGEVELFAMIKKVRNKLKEASWGSEDEWDGKENTYRYKDPLKKPIREEDLKNLKEDLVRMARCGYEFYCQFGSQLGGKLSREMMNLMIDPGYLQIAMKESPNFIFPAAMIYDYPIDNIIYGKYELCEEFIRGLKYGEKLESLSCFNGHCPSYGERLIICPSGFWGFRHYLGMPLSVKLAPEVPAAIEYDQHINMVMCEATDLELLAQHENNITHLNTNLMQVKLAKQRQDVFDYLKQSPHLVYFYCHGGYVDEDIPVLKIGSEQNPEWILPSNLITYNVYWENPRPLVFLNGCHTAAVDPLKALQFIRPLVEDCQCAGVIGTEITVFEGLAKTMAEEFFSRLINGETTGKALRAARLKLLAEGNPLGLVYIPFVLATLQIKK